jgi:DNA-directed RNA polymerase subunit beta
MTNATTQYSFTEKKRIRKDFGKSRSILECPSCSRSRSIPTASSCRSTSPSERADVGLHAALQVGVPDLSYSGNAALEYVELRSASRCSTSRNASCVA